MASGTAGPPHLSGDLWTRGCWHHDRRSRSAPLCPLVHGRSPQQCSSSTTCLWVLSSTPMVLHALCMLTQTFLFNVYLHIFKFLGRWLKYLPAHWSHCFCSCFPTFCLFQQLFYRFPGGEKKGRNLRGSHPTIFWKPIYAMNVTLWKGQLLRHKTSKLGDKFLKCS